MPDRFARHREQLVSALLTTPGDLPLALRVAIFDRAAGQSNTENIPAALGVFVDKVLANAYKVVDRDVDALLQSGLSEDAIYEAICATAAGAGMRRIMHGLDAMQRVKHTGGPDAIAQS